MVSIIGYDSIILKEVLGDGLFIRFFHAICVLLKPHFSRNPNPAKVTALSLFKGSNRIVLAALYSATRFRYL